MKKRVLTGVKPTQMPHLGNYLGAIKPALELAKKPDTEAFLFIADYHSLTSTQEAEKLGDMNYEVAACWLACGLDPNRTVIYKQSDIPEIFELSWILGCFTNKGLMNRAHAYKAKVTENQEAGKTDVDYNVNMGLYTYPVLMAADIILFDTDQVPVGEDQIQHVEIARDIATKFNNHYSPVLKIPEYFVKKDAMLIPGLDGRKMSKSYNNHIPLFCSEEQLRKLVMKIKTDSSPPDTPKETKDNLVFDIFKHFASSDQVQDLAARYQKGIGWGEAKQALYEVLNQHIKPYRAKYNDLMADKTQIDKILKEGSQKAREVSVPVMQRVRKAIGL